MFATGQPINFNNVNMGLAMMQMNQLAGWNFNLNQMPLFLQMVNSNPMYLMMWNQILMNMQNIQAMQMNNPNAMFPPGVNINNQPPNTNNGQGNIFKININFVTADGNKVMIQTDPNELMSSVINKYINKSGDFNAGNYYIFNNKRVVQSLTVAELGVGDLAEIVVANAASVIGAVL